MYEIFEQLLQLKRVTPYQVSKATGISQPTLSAWKKGTYTPKQDKLQKVADYFGVSLDYLLGRTDSIVVDTKKAAVTFIPDETIMAYMKLDEIDRAEIKGTIKQMLKADKYSVKTNLSDYAELAAEGGTETRGRKKKKVEILE